MPHDRPWEWEAQRHLRQLSQLLKSGDLVLIARSGADVVGCVHLQFSTEGTLLEAFHAAAGVALDVRRQGGRVPDQLLAEARKIAFTKAIQSGSSHLVLAGKVHVRNAASQHMLTRAGWEPRDAPSNDYQLWAAIIPVE